METARKTSTAATRRFRERVQELGYRRMEIVADALTINNLRAVAKANNMPTYEALEQAVKLLVRWHEENIAGKRTG